MEILGNIFKHKGTDHVDHRPNKGSQSFYCLGPVELEFCTSVILYKRKCSSNLCKHVCQLSLIYGLDYVTVTDKGLPRLSTIHDKFINQALGLSKHAHKTQLLRAKSIKQVTDIVDRIP